MNQLSVCKYIGGEAVLKCRWHLLRHENENVSIFITQMAKLPIYQSIIVSFAAMNLYMYILKREKKGSHDFIQNLQNYFSLDIKILF